MSTTNTPSNSSMHLKDWIAIVSSFLSLATMIYNLVVELQLNVFIIALIIFIISGIYYLIGLHKNRKYKTLWKIYIVFYIFSVGIALGGSWYYYTQYDPDGFPIERLTYYIYPYEGPENATEPGSVYLTLSNSYQTYRLITSYDMEYDVPNVDEAWAGFSIEFFQPIDLSKYKSIQLKIQYSDPNALVRLVLKDDAGNDADVMLDSKFVTGEKTDSQTITVPLDLFQHITLNNVREFVIDANSYFISGSHEVRISEIHFVK